MKESGVNRYQDNIFLLIWELVKRHRVYAISFDFLHIDKRFLCSFYLVYFNACHLSHTQKYVLFVNDPQNDKPIAISAVCRRSNQV